MGNDSTNRETSGPPSGRWIARALGLADGVGVVPAAGGPSWREGGTPRTRFLEIELVADDGRPPNAALLRVVPFDGAEGGLDPEGFASERQEHRFGGGASAWLGPPDVPLEEEERLAALPPILACAEKRVLIAVPGEEEEEDPVAVLEGVVRSGGAKIPGDAVPCLACDRRERCFPAAADPTKGIPAAAVLSVVSAHPWGGLVTERPDLDWDGWVRLASGGPSPDRSIPRPLATGREHGRVFAVETLLVRAELLRQALEALHDLHARTGHPHLDLRPSGLAFRLAPGHPWAPSLWTARLKLLESGPGHAAGEGYAPPAGRPAELVPAACASGGWVEGRCLPGGGAEPWTLPRWDLKFLPGTPDRTPERGAVVRFELASGKGRTSVLGRIAVAFQEVWSVQVEAPGEQRAAIEELLAGGAGHPMIRVREVADHSLEDDLFALGTIWLSLLLADGAPFGEAVALRDALASAGPATGAKGLAAVARNAAALRYHAGEGADAGLLPPLLLEGALELGRRLTGGDPDGLPGEGHEPTTPEARERVLAGLRGEAADLAALAREILFGGSAEEAEIRVALEGIGERVP